MKKIIFLSAIIISTLVSCSTEDAPTYNPEPSKTISTKETPADFCITCRDSIGKTNDTLETVNPKPIKP